MPRPSTGTLASGLLLAALFTACQAGGRTAPRTPPLAATTARATPPPPPSATADPRPPPPSPPAAVAACPHGEVEDGHRGGTRCLTEAEAAARSPAPTPSPPAALPAGGAPAAGRGANGGGAAQDAPQATTPPPRVTPREPEFEGGEVPKLASTMKRLSKEMAACVAEHGGLAGASGAVRVRFLVRVRGRAEGVEIDRVRGVKPEAVACLKRLFKNRAVGAPTADPVGVTVMLDLGAAP